MTLTRFLRSVAALVLSLAGAFSFAGPVLAQEETPKAENAVAYLYEGTCDDLAGAKEMTDIDDLSDEDNQDHWNLLGQGDNPPDGLGTAQDDAGEGIRDMTDLNSTPHAIIIRESSDADSAILVCGNVNGPINAVSWIINLDEVEGSGFEGRAAVQNSADDDERVQITVAIYPAGSVPMVATPAASPSPMATPER